MTAETIATGGTLEEARGLLQEGHPRKAAQTVAEWLRNNPDDPHGYHLLGASYAAMGDAAAAATSLGRAVALNPADGHHRVAFAIALGVFGEMERASREYADARRLCGSTFGAFEFGVVCLCRGSDEAQRHFEELLDTDGGDARAGVGVALARAQAGRVDEARAAFAALAETDPTAHLVPRAICDGLDREGRTADAREILRLATLVGVQDPELPYRLAAASGATLPKAPAGYVRSHYDRFADTFDVLLRDGLRYGTPEVLVEAAGRHVSDRSGLSVLDGGCGTGLCGPLLRPMAGMLIGVDLSQAMLEKARARGVYDGLQRGDLVKALAERRAELDLIMCADVLIYLGDLRELFDAAGGALRPGGVLAVSVESLETGEDYALRPAGRFAHSLSYLEAMSTRAGLELVETAPSDLRLERGRWIPGTLGVFRRPR